MIVLVTGLIFGGCAKPAPAPAPTPAPTPTPQAPPTAPAAPTPAPKVVEPIKLKWAHGVPPKVPQHAEAFVPWAEMIKERTTAIGKPVEITIYPAETLVKNLDTYDSLIKGVCDLASNWGPQHFPGRMPVNEVLNLPLLFPSATAASFVSQELFETRPEIQNELRESKTLGFHPPVPFQIVSRTRPIKTLEDLKGIKAGAKGATESDIMKALGAVPVPMPMPEIYLGLERGTIDTANAAWQGVIAYKWYEVTKYRTELPKGLSSIHLLISMNLNSWNKLPPDVQKIFNELSGVYLSKLCGQVQDKAEAGFIDILKKYDAKAGNPDFYYMPQDEFERWRQAVTPLYEKWMVDIEAKGLPGRAIFADVQRLTEKYGKQYPK